jgi:hypothetical protein
MKDKGFGIFLRVLFGIGGICILVFMWTQTMPASERIVSQISLGRWGYCGC